ncbi:FixH family protein [Thiogranum longum]|jgi:hypothetical protein
MYQHSSSEHSTPWYRQGWPWLLISLPASAVIGGIITIILAVQSPNALVVDDYYKEGLAINQEKQRLEAARNMALEGLLRSDGKGITLQLHGKSPVAESALTLSIVHSTRAELDRELTLRSAAAGHYVADMPLLSGGTWYLRLQPADGSWEIRSRIAVDGPFQALLTGNG